MLSRKENSKKYERLVEDQPGLFIFSSGLVLALVFGLLFRNYFNPQRIYSEVIKASQRMHPSLVVEIGSAELSLSDHGLPSWAILIKDIKIESSEKCWGTPALNVDLITLPISWIRWIEIGKPFDVFQIHNAELVLRNEIKTGCNPQAESGIVKKESSSGQAVVLVQKESQAELRQKDFDELKLKSLSVRSPQLGSSSFELENISLIEKSMDPYVVVLKASTPLFRDAHDFDYSTKADLQIEYSDFPEKKIQSHLIGQFREGHFAIHLQNRIEENLYTADLEFKHLPLSKVFSVFHKYNFFENLSPKQVWLSMKGRSQGVFKGKDDFQLEIKDFNLEGDVGTVKTDLIEITGFKPFHFKPFLMQTQNLDFEKVLDFFKSKKEFPMLGNFGQFSGRIELLQADEFRLFGKHKMLEFIFSNKGQRQIQRVKEMSLDIARKKNNVNLSMNRFDLEDGQFDGEINLKIDLLKALYKLNIFAGRFELNPQVQRLVSQDKELGSLKGNLEIVTQDNELKSAIGKLSSDSLTVEKIHFENPEFVVRSEKNKFLLNVKSKNFSVPKEMIQGGVLAPVIPESWQEANLVYLQGLNSDFQFKDSTELHWKNFKAQVSGGRDTVTSEGFYNKEILSGQLMLQEDRQKKKWKIEGTRNEPQITESNH